MNQSMMLYTIGINIIADTGVTIRNLKLVSISCVIAGPGCMMWSCELKEGLGYGLGLPLNYK